MLHLHLEETSRPAEVRRLLRRKARTQARDQAASCTWIAGGVVLAVALLLGGWGAAPGRASAGTTWRGQGKVAVPGVSQSLGPITLSELRAPPPRTSRGLPIPQFARSGCAPRFPPGAARRRRRSWWSSRTSRAAGGPAPPARSSSPHHPESVPQRQRLANPGRSLCRCVTLVSTLAAPPRRQRPACCQTPASPELMLLLMALTLGVGANILVDPEQLDRRTPPTSS
ncbi:hypothetical protein QJS66_11645 [Kocuria rhizophila]|nr:hypothetical protein QJS66_11645 [Kocuria rhizophila]